MRKLIMRQIHEFKYRSKDKEFNPYALRNRCSYIQGGYIGIIAIELTDKTRVGKSSWKDLKQATMEEDYME